MRPSATTDGVWGRSDLLLGDVTESSASESALKRESLSLGFNPLIRGWIVRVPISILSVFGDDSGCFIEGDSVLGVMTMTYVASRNARVFYRR